MRLSQPHARPKKKRSLDYMQGPIIETAWTLVRHFHNYQVFCAKAFNATASFVSCLLIETYAVRFGLKQPASRSKGHVFWNRKLARTPHWTKK